MKTRTFPRALALAFGATLALTAAASAEPVAHEHLGLELGANLELAPGKGLAADGTILVVHGTLAHHDTEIMRALQRDLAARGLSSLAITLSLGLDKRRGAYDCALEHDHRHSDAPEEIAAWIDWLRAKGAGRVWLAGHSRGGAQVALYAANAPHAAVAGTLLLAPTTGDADATQADYHQATGRDLGLLLAAAQKQIDAGDGDGFIEVPLFLYCPQARVTAEAFLDYYEADPKRRLAALLPEIALPTLVVVAGADEVVPALPAMLAATRLPATMATATVEGADHFFRDLHGDDLADRIAVFVRGK